MDAQTLEEFRRTVKRFTRERLVPIEEEVAEHDCVPDEILAEMREMGLYGLTVPEEYGGVGLGSSEEIELILELTWASAAFRSQIGINLGLGTQAILTDGTEEQKRAWLPGIAAGDIVTSFCLTEPGSGSDAASLRSRAIRDGDSYVLTGTKRYIINAPLAGVFLVMARTSDENLPKNAHVTAFLVPANTPSLSVGAKDRKMGQAGA